MIKLNELKKGDIIYQICKYHWINKIKITSKLIPFEYQTLKEIQNDAIEYYIKGKGTFDLDKTNFTDLEKLDKQDEINLYRTYNEAKNAFNNFKKERILYLQQNNNLLKELYKQAIKTGRLTDSDKLIYTQLINNCTISFNIKEEVNNYER